MTAGNLLRGQNPLDHRFEEQGELSFGYLVSMSNESDPKTYEERAWQYFLQLQPSITDVSAAAELAFRAVDAFDRGLERRRAQRAQN
jgi:hypothetical protein